MITLNDGKVGTREFLAIIIFMIGIKFKDTTADLLYEVGKNAAWMIPIFAFLFFLVPFIMLLSLLKKHQVGFTELIFTLTGKFIGSVFVLAMFVVFFFATIINFRSHAEIINTLFYDKTPLPVLVFLIVLASLFIASLGFESIGRTAWLILPTFLALMVLLVILAWPQLTFGFLFPIAGPGFGTIVKESVKHSAIVTEVVVLASLYTFVRTDREFRKSSAIGVIFSCFQLAFFFIVIVLAFDYPGVAHMNFPYQQLTRYVTIGPIISHIEGLFLGFWSLVTAIHFAIYLFLNAYVLGSLLRLYDYRRLLIPLTGLVFFISLIPENVFTALDYRKQVVGIGSWYAFSLVVLLWVVDRWKRRESS